MVAVSSKHLFDRSCPGLPPALEILQAIPRYSAYGASPDFTKEYKMANILRYRPIDDTFDDLFRGFFMRPVRFDGQQEIQLKMDVSEDDKAYTVHAEMPGVKKEDINVSIEGSQVAISAEVKKEKEVKEGEKLLRSERYFGRVYRALTLPQDVDEDTAQAKYDNGVLELVLPKRIAAKARSITIQ
jgi:HSP20 family protein